MDRAGWHTSRHLKIPPGLNVVLQPSKSPELQPSERLWPPIREVLANRPLDNLEQVQELLIERCCELMEQPERIRSMTNFHWWKKAVSSVETHKP